PETLRLNAEEVAIAGTASDLPGFAGLTPWVLFDASVASEYRIAQVYDRLLIRSNDSFVLETAQEQLRGIFGEDLIIITPDEALQRVFAQPTVIGLTIALIAA